MAYDKKITIQKLTVSSDSKDNQIETWTDLCNPWASVNTIGGREYYAAAQINAENDVVFKIRYSRSLKTINTKNARILYDGKTYDIKHIDDFMEQHRELVIKAEEVI